MSETNFQVFTADELSNEEYHAETDHISGTSLSKIFDGCLAKWRYDEKQEADKSKALVFGTVSHAQVLEPERFDNEFVRLPDLDIDYPDKEKRPITSVSGLQSWMKERGLPGRSKTDAFELIEIIKQAVTDSGEPLPLFWHEIMKLAHEEADSKLLVPGKDYDLVQRMREVLFNNEQFHRILTSGTPELSIYGTLWGVKCKVRFDRVTDDAEIWDYKTCDSAEPSRFTRRSFDLGYPLKMALQYHMFKGAYGRAPGGVVLLAQEKVAPFLPLECRLTEKTLRIGTAQLRQAMALYTFGKENDKWPGYNGGLPYEMDPPYYIESQYKHLFEDMK